MAITYAREAFAHVQPEYSEFVHEYWNNSPENSGHMPLDFNWDMYHRLDADNMLHLTIGREYGKIVAAALYMLLRSFKHKDVRMALCDTFAVARDYRGRGVGRQLFEAVEPMLVNLGINQICNMYREVYKTTPLFESLGFEFVERVYLKKV